MTTLRRTLLAAASALAALPAGAAAEPAVGVLASGDAIVHFDTGSPSSATSLLRVTGLASASERIVGVDYRHEVADGGTGPGLYALTVDPAGALLRLYRLDPGTGAATPVGAGVTALVPGQRWGFDFNPAADRLRVVNENDESLRLNPNSGASAGDDTNLSPAGVEVTGVAYDRAATKPSTGPTTLFAIDNAAGALGRIGSVDGTTSPNGGVFTAIGPLGVTPDAGSSTDLDISVGAVGDAITAATAPVAYATLTAGGQQRLYTLDLATGAATAIGETAARLTAFAVLPTTNVGFGLSPYVTTTPVGLPPIRESEGAGGVALLISRSGDLSSTLPVRWRASNGPDGRVVFAPGERTQTITVPWIRDDVDEPDESIDAQLRPDGVPVRFGIGARYVIIEDDDPTPPAPQAPAPDTVRPTVTLGKLPSSITYRKLTTGQGLTVSVGTSEPVSLEAALLGKPRGGVRLRAASASLVDVAYPLGSAPRTVRLKPRTRDLKRPTRTVTLKVQVRAYDAAGNRSTVTKTVKLKPR